MAKIILALDEIQDLEEGVKLIQKVGPLVYAVKIHNLYDKYGPEIVGRLKKAGAQKVWVDFKLYDIPNTVKLRAENIPADIISVHASGGGDMMKQAVSSGKEIFAVTMLTSFSPEEVKGIYNREIGEAVRALAHIAKEAGVSGIVCSPQEIKMLKESPELSGLKLVVPGIRSLGREAHDQNRVGTPAQAVMDGADYLVIGRQITQALDPVAEVNQLLEEIREYSRK